MQAIPSLYAHIMSGVLLFIATLYFLKHMGKILSRDPYQILVLILLLSTAVSLHGMSHLGLESIYNYNPLSLLTTIPSSVNISVR
jgi:hypothetical protein